MWKSDLGLGKVLDTTSKKHKWLNKDKLVFKHFELQKIPLINEKKKQKNKPQIGEKKFKAYMW